MDPTVAYYESNADEYFDSTVSVDMSDVHRMFLELLPVGGKILDVGCGSGRDLKAFSTAGFQAEGLEPSTAMANRASAYSGCNITCKRVQELDWVARFDGIWCCASLLHVPRLEFPEVLKRITRALKDNGTCYLSLKKGDGEGVEAGRHYTYWQEDEFRTVLNEHSAKIVRFWNSPDRRGRSDVWINCLFRLTIQAPVGLSLVGPTGKGDAGILS